MEVPMRRVRYSVAMSLDGYIAGPNGEADWIVMDPELGAWFPEFFKQFDTFLLGRKTFLSAGGKGGGMFGGARMVVVSTTLDPKNYPGVTIISHDVREAVTALRAEEGKDIWLFGGGQLFRS